MSQSGFEMVRYADDFVILCRTPAAASQALDLVRQWVSDHDLTLHPTKTRLVQARTESFDFLGDRFEGGRHGPRPPSLKKFKDKVRSLTKRTHGDSLPRIITVLNRALRGWFADFQHSPGWLFVCPDGWIRHWLRTILRRRDHRRGPGRGWDHRRWPNAFFADQGLFRLARAHALARQSSWR
ncbi:hypothetical protein BH23PLA1_BH23PLA1_32150 [soil metagenome]